MQATVELVGERGYAETTLGDIAQRAGVARGLVSYYFPSKRYLLQNAVHRLMHLTLGAALAELPEEAGPDLRMARTIDAILGIALVRPLLMRTHLAFILAPDADGFVEDPEQQQLGRLLQGVLAAQPDSREPVAEHAVLRSALMGGCMGLLLPNAETPLPPIRADLYARYRLGALVGRDPYLPAERLPWAPGGSAGSG
jgi:AcrR family transcriptional regulator